MIITYDKKQVLEQFKKKLGFNLNLSNPKLFCEKLCWLKLFDRNLDYTKMVDKYSVKDYVKNIIGEEHIIPTLGVYKKFDDIDFNSLPKKFVMKCTHDSGSVVVVKDKNKLDLKSAKEKLTKAMSRNYYDSWFEYQYKNIEPRIIIEPYLSDNMRDYKFFCFNGTPKFLYISDDSSDHKKMRLTFVGFKKWTRLPFFRKEYRQHDKKPGLKKPSKLDEMIEISKKLSKGIPFVRVDMYQIEDKVYFSELTFHPGDGRIYVHPREWNIKLGDMLDISKVFDRKLHYEKRLKIYDLCKNEEMDSNISLLEKFSTNVDVVFPCHGEKKYEYIYWDKINAHHMTPLSNLEFLKDIMIENGILPEFEKHIKIKEQSFSGKILKYPVPITGKYIIKGERGTISGGPEILYRDIDTSKETNEKILSVIRHDFKSEYHRMFSFIHDRAEITNIDIDNYSVLVIGDSMIGPDIPILATHVHQLDFFDWRSRPSEKIDMEKYDKVIICTNGRDSFQELIHFMRQFVKQVYDEHIDDTKTSTENLINIHDPNDIFSK